MKKRIPFRIESYFLSVSIASLIRQGKSVYEIGTVLKAHERLVHKFIFTDELRALLEDNNQHFINKFISEYTDDVERSKAMDTYSAYYHPYFKTTCFTSSFRKSFEGWLKKYSSKNILFSNVITKEEKMQEGILTLSTSFNIINAHFDGNSPRAVARQFNCSLKQLRMLFRENNISETVNEGIVKSRVREAISANASYEFIKNHFRKIPVSEIKMMQMQHKIFEKIKHLPYRDNYYYMKEKYSSPNTLSLNERQTEKLNQLKCLRYFSLGNEVPQIARIMGLNEQKVISLLRKSQALA